PSLKTILDEWDSFASDDYYLAPDTEKFKKENAKRKQQEQEQAKIEQEQTEKFEKEKTAELNKVCDKESAIDYLNKYYKFSENLLAATNDFQTLAKEYNFSSKDVIKARANV
ncbi:hypothetical protein IJS77_04670, partial [bacterium]|nr:hypothetical protein [bacterium]